jgi:Malectin domain
MKIFQNLLVGAIVLTLSCTVWADRVLYAVNLGGKSQIGFNGIYFEEDNGTHGKAAINNYRPILEAPGEDQLIYKTAFWGPELNLVLPVDGNGDYRLTLKFAEDFERRTMNVLINDMHLVAENLSVYDEAGALFTAFDKSVMFSVQEDQLFWNDETSEILDDRISFRMTTNNKYIVLISGLVWEKVETAESYMAQIAAAGNPEDIEQSKLDHIIRLVKRLEQLLKKTVEKVRQIEAKHH